MLKEIDNITLVRRSPENTRRKRSEPGRPLLKSRGKPETIAITQQWGCHRNSQIFGSVWFVANAIRDNNCRVALRRWIDLSK
jgi:hypothetical protein